MKLLNYTLFYLTSVLFAIVSLWAVLFYFQILEQLKSNMDEGLANYKLLLIDDVKGNDSIYQAITADKNFSIRNIPEDYALQVRDTYKDTLLFSELKNTYFRTRLLTTAFVAENGKYYEMKIVSQELDRGKLIRNLASSLLWLYLFVLISIILVNNFVLKKTWEPFYKTLNYLRDFRLDKENIAEPAKTKIEEFTILNETIQQLLNENVNTFLSQKQFIENASHEIQTPLAIGINKLELLAASTDINDTTISKIGEVIETLQRLSELNKSLLLISKIENKQFLQNESVDFDAIFKRIITDFTDYTEFRKIKINYQAEEKWIFKMNTNLAEILLLNLVKNAIFHNKPLGTVDIKLSLSSFTIENTSDEPALSDKKIFKRFTKNQHKKGSTGLGLSIVKAIADASGLIVNYSYQNSGKHTFKVSL
jgi:signal transduction histidine kinase